MMRLLTFGLVLQIMVCATEDEVPPPPLTFNNGFLSRQENDYIQSICGKKKKHPGAGVQQETVLKMVNGDSVAPSDAPWALAIFNDASESICSGVLISHRHVLTAAHCVQANTMRVKVDTGEIPNRQRTMVIMETAAPHKIRVVMGHHCAETTRYCSESLFGTRTVRKVRRLWVHSNYNRNNTADIAILELACVVMPNHNIMPICLGVNPTEIGQKMNLYGFGKDTTKDPDEQFETLQEIKQKVVDCRDQTILKQDTPLLTNEFCTLSDHSGKKMSVCGGDSGGGVVGGPDKNGRMNLFGIIASSDACTEKSRKNPDFIFMDHQTHVPHFISWIARKTGVCPSGHSCEIEPRRLESDVDGDLTLASKTQTLLCDDNSWWMSTRGTDALCYKTVYSPSRLLNASEAEAECKKLDAGNLSPIRNEAELMSISVTLRFSGAVVDPNNEVFVIVGGFWDTHKNQFRWDMDRSFALRDRGHIDLWEGKGESIDEYGHETYCMAARVQYGVARLTEIACDYETEFVSCAKPPQKRTVFPEPPIEPVC